MFCNIDEALLTAIVAVGVFKFTLCFLAHSTMLPVYFQLGVKAFVDAGCMSIAPARRDVCA